MRKEVFTGGDRRLSISVPNRRPRFIRINFVRHHGIAFRDDCHNMSGKVVDHDRIPATVCTMDTDWEEGVSVHQNLQQIKMNDQSF
jgi:hypothetical protein